MAFTFDKQKRLYFKDGRPVKAEVLRSWVSEVMERTRGEMESVTKQFLEGSINRAAWTLEMKGLVGRSHSALWMLAQGGRNAMDESAWGSVGQRIKVQLGNHLRGFERDFANDRIASDEQAIARARLYANPLHQTYQAAVLAREKASGASKVLRVLGSPATGHCGDCPDLAGEYDIDDVPEIGASECGPACNCEIIPLEAEVSA